MKKILFIFAMFLCLFTIACSKTNDKPDDKKDEPIVEEDIIITYVTNCEIVKEKEKVGANSLDPLTREGFTFDGWYLDSGFKTKANASLITESTTVYAKWSEVLINVKVFSGETLLDVLKMDYNGSVNMDNYLLEGLKFVSADKDITNIKEDIELHCVFSEISNAVIFVVGEDKIQAKLINPNLIGIQIDFKLSSDAEFDNVLPKASVNKKGNDYSFIYSNQKNINTNKDLFTLTVPGEISDINIQAYVREDNGDDININPISVEYYIIEK